MNELTAVVLGATGLTGNLIVEELLNHDDFKTVRILGRRKLDMVHPKLEQYTVDFNNLEDYSNKFGEGDVIFSCIGTTQKKVKGDKELYRKIDYDIPVNGALIAVSKGFKRFLLVSSVGANEKSSNFYLRLKGETESSLKKIRFDMLGIFQPSILNGSRPEVRMGEKITQGILEIISFLFIGPLKKYHPIGANNVAKAMIYAALKSPDGVNYYTYQEMMDLAREYNLSKE